MDLLERYEDIPRISSKIRKYSLDLLEREQDILSVVPAVRVLSLAWAPRGLHRAMFMNSVSHGKVWTKNAASSLKSPVFLRS